MAQQLDKVIQSAGQERIPARLRCEGRDAPVGPAVRPKPLTFSNAEVLKAVTSSGLPAVCKILNLWTGHDAGITAAIPESS